VSFTFASLLAKQTLDERLKIALSKPLTSEAVVAQIKIFVIQLWDLVWVIGDHDLN